jgi:homoserine O-acetyltransferase
MRRLILVAAFLAATAASYSGAVAQQASAPAASATNLPAPKEGDWVASSFTFHTGEVLQQVKLHFTTLGPPTGQPVLMLHGTYGSGSGFLAPAIAGTLFGPGQPLDATKYYIIMPDALGSGKSTKPSDGLKTKFPKYDYADMVTAQYRLVTEGLGIKHLRVIIGNSMGGMQTWLWGEKYPGFMDALVPMAATPGEMSARNWMLRRMMVEMVINDPAYANGNYTTQPASLKYANVFYGIATSGGTLGYQTIAPTNALANQQVDARLSGAAPPDANDWAYQWLSSADYNPTPELAKIQAPLLAINSADDERNPPELGILDSALKQVKSGKAYIIPVSTDTRGHATTGLASFWAKQFDQFMQGLPPPAGQ